MGLRERLLNYIAYKGIDKATLERKSGLSTTLLIKWEIIRESVR